MHYAASRVRRHLETMNCLDQALQAGGLDRSGVAVRIEQGNPPFRDVDVLRIYREALSDTVGR
jgi:hypothetical protein